LKHERLIVDADSATLRPGVITPPPSVAAGVIATPPSLRHGRAR